MHHFFFFFLCINFRAGNNTCMVELKPFSEFFFFFFRLLSFPVGFSGNLNLQFAIFGGFFRNREK